MKVVTGLWQPSQGTVLVNGREVDRSPEHRRHGLSEPDAPALANDAG